METHRSQLSFYAFLSFLRDVQWCPYHFFGASPESLAGRNFSRSWSWRGKRLSWSTCRRELILNVCCWRWGPLAGLGHWRNVWPSCCVCSFIFDLTRVSQSFLFSTTFTVCIFATLDARMVHGKDIFFPPVWVWVWWLEHQMARDIFTIVECNILTVLKPWWWQPQGGWTPWRWWWCWWWWWWWWCSWRRWLRRCWWCWTQLAKLISFKSRTPKTLPKSVLKRSLFFLVQIRKTHQLHT